MNRGHVFQVDVAVKSQRLFGFDEREITASIRTFSKQAKTAVDVGASDGWYALHFASQPNIEAVVAIEPSPDNVRELHANFALNDQAFAAKLRVVSMLASDLLSHDATTVDAELANAKPPFLLKIDVDGAEMSVLRGARNVLGSKNCLVVLETHSVELERDANAYLQQLGYRTQIIDNAWYRKFLPEQRVSAQNRWLIAEPVNAGNAGRR